MEHNIFFYIIMFLCALVFVAILTPLLSRLAIKNNILDHPNAHKTHIAAKPLLGGVAVFLGIVLTMLFTLEIDDKLISLGTGTLVLFITGLLDDLYDIRPVYKLLGQTAAAAIVVLWNYHLYIMMIDYFKRFSIPAAIVIILIIGWIVLMINAFNLIDGLDGLAAGTAAIIFAAMAILTVLSGGNPNLLGVQLIALGACLGFLIHNFYPAKIFMGDTGSMLLGFLLANVHLFTIKFPFSATLVLGSIFIFAYPALDLTYAFYRRIYHKCSIFKADRGHIHHILLGLGFSTRKAVLIIYFINFIFALLAVLLFILDLKAQTLLIIEAFTAALVIFMLNYFIKLSERAGIL